MSDSNHFVMNNLYDAYKKVNKDYYNSYVFN